MLKDTLIFKIFLRFLKEKNIIIPFKNGFYDDYCTHIKRFINSTENNGILTAFSIYIVPYDKHKVISNFNEFCINRQNNIEFNRILLYAMKPYYKEFLIKNKILNRFLFNLYYSKLEMLEIKIDRNNIKKYADLIIDKYLELMVRFNYPVFSFIRNAFGFSVTNEGISYWQEINEDFKKFIRKKMMSNVKVNKKSKIKELILKIKRILLLNKITS